MTEKAALDYCVSYLAQPWNLEALTETASAKSKSASLRVRMNALLSGRHHEGDSPSDLARKAFQGNTDADALICNSFLLMLHDGKMPPLEFLPYIEEKLRQHPHKRRGVPEWAAMRNAIYAHLLEHLHREYDISPRISPGSGKRKFGSGIIARAVAKVTGVRTTPSAVLSAARKHADKQRLCAR